MSPSRPSSAFRAAVLVAALLPLAGCDMLGIETATATAARKEAEGRAIGAACRHAGRAIEDCFGLNKKADKAAVFAGWKEMNDYMRENDIAVVPAQGVGAPLPVAKDDSEDGADEEPAADAGKRS